MALAPKRGLFILLEGCDRTGKTTQVQLLQEALTNLGHPVVSRRFPGGRTSDSPKSLSTLFRPLTLTCPSPYSIDRSTTVGKAIDEYLSSALTLDDRAIHLLFSANRWEAMQELQKTLMEGTHVIVDRYSASGIAYSVAKGLPLDWCRDPDRGLLRPDLVLLLDQPIAIAAAREGWGKERYEKVEFQEQVRSCFHHLLRQEKNDWKVIDASQELLKVHANLLEYVQQIIEDPEVRSHPLSFDLWQRSSELSQEE
ncbi:MAG: deoxythymidylate kinase-like protein [Piptocephalis tieghemiana]|nr:MAG: deoxythymidylate kinase-like protein [Piptocephalis tieghemiana]